METKSSEQKRRAADGDGTGKAARHGTRGATASPLRILDDGSIEFPEDYGEDWGPLEKMLFTFETDQPGPWAKHYEAGIRRAEQLVRMLEGAFFELRLGAAMAQSEKVRQIAFRALAKHYVEIGKEYARAGKAKSASHLFTRLERLLRKPGFKKEFDFHQSIQNHEQLARTPAMVIVLDAVQSDPVLDTSIWEGAGRADKDGEDGLWQHCILPAITARWPELQRRYLEAEKRRSLGSWANRLRRAWGSLWQEIKRRHAHCPDWQWPVENFAVGVAREKERNPLFAGLGKPAPK